MAMSLYNLFQAFLFLLSQNNRQKILKTVHEATVLLVVSHLTVDNHEFIFGYWCILDKTTESRWVDR